MGGSDLIRNDKKKVYCLTPVFNDWESCTILIANIARIQNEFPMHQFLVVIVNDGSTEECEFQKSDIIITQLNLKVNVGHQRAIAIGLQYIYNEISDYDYVLVMDSDGEDKPEDIPILLQEVEKQSDKKIIFAERRKRQESVLFKTGYFFYKRLFKLLTNHRIGFGNFSIIPKKQLGKVVYQNNIWNHYSGAIIQSKIPYCTVLLNRGKRYRGTSKMKFNNLLLHGLSSIAVYFDFLSIRILRFSLYGVAICFISVVFILYQKLFTDNAIPGWASSLILIISGIIIQLFSVTLIVLLLQLSSRKNITAPDAKIYKEFIDDIKYLI
ncbi:glycosyl transferase family 2 [Flavobacterium album]|uniref:Glycosyl transferase family 2 n=1 Tax=Flavobacterium album TaxID=2175091 RepID=A0A2S1QVM6_9FLAO|nr:glycosyltransferase [Flavobacterium album]AWH84444.1 glycosyl transferase family 2 [Flavobacterium album]